MSEIQPGSRDVVVTKLSKAGHWVKKTALLLLLGFLACPMPLEASGKGSKYPLRIQVGRASYGCTDCGLHTSIPDAQLNRETFDLTKHYSGVGAGSLLLGPDQSQPFFFAYDGCIDPLPLTNGAFLAARWKKPNQTLEVRVPPFSPKKPVNFAAHRLSNCRVAFSLQPIQPVQQRESPTHYHIVH